MDAEDKPSTEASTVPLAGVRLATVASGIRYRDRDDLLLVELAAGTTVAGVQTRSQVPAAPVVWCRERLPAGSARALVVSAGNANAATGDAGRRCVEQTATEAARLLGCRSDEVLVAATGIIGVLPPAAKIIAGLQHAATRLGSATWQQAADAIRTTDTFAKFATRRARLDDRVVTLHGFAKGSGMIAPNMATLLGFVFTDATVPAMTLRSLLEPAIDRSFHSITVDGDCSTNDAVFCFATGQAHPSLAEPSLAAPPTDSESPTASPRWRGFAEGLQELLIDLAQQVVRDGEGAGKFITVHIRQARSEEEARRIGLAVAHSPLVKTAIAGEDANWGRILMALGNAPVELEASRIRLRIGGHLVAEHGAALPNYDETPVALHMRGSEITLDIELGLGEATATVWTCDLTHEYIRINADYRS